jgi:glycine cleavage system aminomethyltransferase T
MSLQDKIDRFGSPLEMLRASPTFSPFPYPLWYSTWREEQRAWHDTAILFDQSFHMSDLYITGPDALKLLQDTSVNSYAAFEPGRAKQYLAVNEEGYIVGDNILVRLSEEEVTLAGFEFSLNWLEYHAQAGNYDVSFSRDPNSQGQPGSKRLYRYEVEGPNAWKILEKAAGKKLDHINFFRTGKLPIAGHEVWALNHTMGGVPGQDSTGLELFGPEAEGPDVINAILEAGKEFGLLRGGALSYASTTAESGWVGGIIPAVYTSPGLRGYREWLPDTALENFSMALNGSYAPAAVEDFYLTPWDLGYGHVIKHDHDFIGRSALESMATQPHRTKVWLEWNTEDTERVLVDSELDRPDAPKLLTPPMTPVWDQILVNGSLGGFTQLAGYTVNLGGWTSVGSLDSELAEEGAEVELVWGDADGGVSNPMVPPHTQTNIRATVRLTSPVL